MIQPLAKNPFCVSSWYCCKSNITPTFSKLNLMWYLCKVSKITPMSFDVTAQSLSSSQFPKVPHHEPKKQWPWWQVVATFRAMAASVPRPYQDHYFRHCIHHHYADWWCYNHPSNHLLGYTPCIFMVNTVHAMMNLFHQPPALSMGFVFHLTIQCHERFVNNHTTHHNAAFCHSSTAWCKMASQDCVLWMCCPSLIFRDSMW